MVYFCPMFVFDIANVRISPESSNVFSGFFVFTLHE